MKFRKRVQITGLVVLLLAVFCGLWIAQRNAVLARCPKYSFSHLGLEIYSYCEANKGELPKDLSDLERSGLISGSLVDRWKKCMFYLGNGLNLGRSKPNTIVAIERADYRPGHRAVMTLRGGTLDVPSSEIVDEVLGSSRHYLLLDNNRIVPDE